MCRIDSLVGVLLGILLVRLGDGFLHGCVDVLIIKSITKKRCRGTTFVFFVVTDSNWFAQTEWEHGTEYDTSYQNPSILYYLYWLHNMTAREYKFKENSHVKDACLQWIFVSSDLLLVRATGITVHFLFIFQLFCSEWC